VTDNAASNIINGDFSGNGGDGIRLDGAEVKQNQVGDGVYTIANGGNGCTVANGATDNKVGVIAKENGENGIALMASKGTEVMKFSSSRGNKKYGILVSGVTDEKTSIGWTSSSENSIASVRFENGTKNVHYLGEIVNESIGLEMDGEDVVKNTVLAGVELCTDGVVITRAQRNKLTLYTSGCGTAVVMKGAKENELVLSTVGKEVLPQGDALHLLETLIDEDTTEGSDNNYITATIGNNQNGIVVENSKDNRFDNLRISNIRAHGVILQGSGTIGNRITNARIGLPFTAEFGSVGGGVGGDGIRIQGGASNNNVGTDAARGAEISNCVGAGIRIMGEGTRENVILGCSIKLGSTQEQEAGIIIEDKSEDIIIGGFTDKERNEISSNKDGIIMRGTYKVLIHNNRIESNSNNGILVENTSDVLIGGSHQSSPNDISSNVVGIQFKGADTTNCRVIGNRIFQNTDGVVIRDNAANNVIENGNILKENKSGIRIEKASQNRILNNVIHDNNLAGVFLSDGAADNLLRGNSIFGNATGVQVTGTTTLRNTIRNNSITANTGKGISLSNGGNREIPPPVLTSFSSNSVIGTASAPDGSSVEIFKDPADEGEKPIAAAAIANGRFRVPVDLKVVQVGLLFQLTGTVTDPSGNTSEFGLVQQFPLFVSEIVFTSTRDENQEIYLQDGFSLFPFRLTNNPADDFSPVFSPNTPEIAFVSTRDGNPEIYTMPPQAGRVATRLTNHSAPDYDPAWSPNGNKIVFVSERDGNPEIYLMNADGTNITRLTNNAGVDRFPVFSPDGTKIAFASNRTGNFEIFVMNADGSNLRNVTQNPADDIQPAWSPDGQLIAFVSERDGNAEIYTMKTDGSQAMRLTNHAAADVSPSWLAGGEGLVFASDRDEGFELYLMGRSGGEAERLTVSNGDNTQPHAALRRQL
jgi:parallel beta-helix repeat protein